MNVCPSCGNQLSPTDLFCPHCGVKVEVNATVGIGKQAWIYFVSFFLPPFGLIWTIRYLRSPSGQLKRVGWVALVLTILGIVLTLWTTMGFLQGVQNQLNSYSNMGL